MFKLTSIQSHRSSEPSLWSIIGCISPVSKADCHSSHRVTWPCLRQFNVRLDHITSFSCLPIRLFLPAMNNAWTWSKHHVSRNQKRHWVLFQNQWFINHKKRPASKHLCVEDSTLSNVLIVRSLNTFDELYPFWSVTLPNTSVFIYLPFPLDVVESSLSRWSIVSVDN
jgi:hypothetical protein